MLLHIYSNFKLGDRNQIVSLKNIALHNHSWKYKQDTQTTNKILAYCTQTEYKDGCSYQGKDHALTLDLDASDMEYTGKKYDKASVTNNISSITGVTCGEIYYEGTNYKKSTTPPTNPGTYTASVTIGGATATKNFTISKVDSTYTTPTAKTLTYNGTEQALVNSGQTGHGKLWYCLKDSGTWQEETVPAAKDAKKYTVLYYLEGDSTHKDVGSQSDPAGSVEVTIEPKDITATITPNGGTYGNVTKAAVALDGVVEDDRDTVSVDLRYSGRANDGSIVTDSVKVPEKAGSYTVSTGTVSNTNYKLKGDSRPFTIAKAKVSAQSISFKEYTGEIQTADIKETPLYEVKENKGGTKAGSYDMVLSLKDAANYTWEATEGKELKVSFIITRTSNTWKTEPSVKGWTYGESHEAPVAEPMYGKDTLVVEYRPADAEDSAYTTEEPKDAGDYKVRFTVVETESYGSLSKVLEFTIQKAAKEAPKLKHPLLLARGKGGNKSIIISWLRYSGASGYEAYWSYCNGKKNYKKFAAVKNNKLTVTHKKLKNNRNYKYYIAAYRMENGKKIYLAKFTVLHVAMKQSKFTNAKSITLNKKKVTLKVNKTFKIQAKVKLESKKKKQIVHTKTYRYYTDNSNVAKVSKKGVITAKAKGRCLVYVLTNNGVYQKIKVTVK